MPSFLWHETIKHNMAGWGHYRPVSHSTDWEYPTDGSQDWLLELEIFKHSSSHGQIRWEVSENLVQTKATEVTRDQVWKHSAASEYWCRWREQSNALQFQSSRNCPFCCVMPWSVSSRQLSNSSCDLPIWATVCPALLCCDSLPLCRSSAHMSPPRWRQSWYEHACRLILFLSQLLAHYANLKHH